MSKYSIAMYRISPFLTNYSISPTDDYQVIKSNQSKVTENCINTGFLTLQSWVRVPLSPLIPRCAASRFFMISSFHVKTICAVNEFDIPTAYVLHFSHPIFRIFINHLYHQPGIDRVKLNTALINELATHNRLRQNISVTSF